MEAANLQLNVIGTRAFTNAMLDHLTDGASIVNMASRAGHGWHQGLDQVKRLAALTGPDQLAAFITDEGSYATRCYNLTKEAVIAWTIAETERMVDCGFRINSLSPGGISTGILGDFQKAFGEKMARNVARVGRPGEAHEIANIAAFVLSPASYWLTGADITIDGGMGAFNQSDAMGLHVLRLATSSLFLRSILTFILTP